MPPTFCHFWNFKIQFWRLKYFLKGPWTAIYRGALFFHVVKNKNSPLATTRRRGSKKSSGKWTVLILVSCQHPKHDFHDSDFLWWNCVSTVESARKAWACVNCERFWGDSSRFRSRFYFRFCRWWNEIFTNRSWTVFKITSVNSMEHVFIIMNVLTKNTKLLALQHLDHASRVSLWEFAVVW